jgi:hypothetical protein
MTNGAHFGEPVLPVTLSLPNMGEREFVALCAEFPESIVEYTADGPVDGFVLDLSAIFS